MALADLRDCSPSSGFTAFTAAACTALLMLGAASAAHAESDANASSLKDPRIGSLIQTLGQTKTPSAASISPDGAIVAWSVRTHDGTQIHLSEVANPDPAKEKIVSTGSGATNCSSSDPKWSPDGESLAFVSDCTAKIDQPGQDQVFLWSKGSGESKQLTHLVGNIDSLAWSPDGKSIAFLFVENATRSAGALAAMKPWSGVIGEDGVEVQRIYGVDVASGLGNWISPIRQLHVYEFNWAPDSRNIAYIAADAPGENNWWVARLYTQYVGFIAACGEYENTDDKGQKTKINMCKEAGAPMGVPTAILDPTKISGPLHGLQIAVPRYSPNGKQIAFIGGIMSDQGSTGGDLYLIPSTGGEPKNITPGRAASVAYFGWAGPELIAMAEHVGGNSHLTALDLATGRDIPQASVTFPETIGAGDLVMSVSISQEHTIAIIRSSFERAPEVWAGPLHDLKQITHLNDSLKPAWGKTENIEWTNGGFKVQGWLLHPANYDPAKKYPLLVSVHGGPSSAVTPRWPGAGYGGAPFSALGYFVFMPNPRGSYGQGEKFTQANIKDFGYGDLHDILTGMDVLEKRFPIDKDREGLTGWSYGGFMTMFGVTQTTRFKAAVAGAGISDWKSYYGENSIDQWMVPFFGKTVYDDAEVYAKSSAIEYIKKVKTPTLVVVGDRDGECPAPQSFEFWHALRAEGVKTQLVIYPNEGHAFHDPAHRRDVLERALNWFETEMPAK
ncbi:S9 family peptidase [Tunturibacter empetritectus]|uniref:Dipeptidyl aminopeptidase/acylaminoacyl peptidase n=1 Tax=Tunturiibacter lichenicola TaxID=2051959 RepID=A0A7W8N5E2_9BACT|nr:S9 family peptidase [Edaphobacter lichenicola]MBB5343910.1 dipeptidyl aminopeptidase/acylaminoacyl peptidase [Edaphobacter lichenicola]